MATRPGSRRNGSCPRSGRVNTLGADQSSGPPVAALLASKGRRRASAAAELRLALFHEGAAAFAKILAVHAAVADLLDSGHVAISGILENLADGELRGGDRQRRIDGDGLGDLLNRWFKSIGSEDAIDKADAQRLGGIDPHSREH